MEPEKKKKMADGDTADSAAKQVHSGKKNPKTLKAIPKGLSKSSYQECVHSKEADTVPEVKAKTKNKRKRNQQGKLDRNAQTEPKDVSKSLSQEFVQFKEAETVPEVKANTKNERKRNQLGKQDRNARTDSGKDRISYYRNEAKEIDKDKREEGRRGEAKSDKTIGGMIFMCNAKTKPDCFRYRVMGISTSRQEHVMSIKPGLKLFLFDFDLKLMYGIYEASSSGGMKLEPAAFAGAFPAQVHFKIYKDCLPLPEGVFKKAIKDSYDEKTHKFKTELTVHQVRKLTVLFRPAPRLSSNGMSSGKELVPLPVPAVQPPYLSTLLDQETSREQVHKEQFDAKARQGSIHYGDDNHHIMPNNGHSSRPLFLTEKEYRNFGLRSERHILPSVAPPAGLPTSHTDDNHKFDNRREQFPGNPISRSDNATLVQKEPGRHNHYFLSEKEYRTFGLRGCQEVPSRPTATVETNRSFEDPIKDACNPYDDSTTSLVNRYLSLPGSVTTSTEPYHLTNRGAYVNVSSYTRGTRDHLGRLNPEVEQSHPSYASHTLSNYNRDYHRLGGEPDITSSKVSSRYCFGGPSLSR